MAAESTKQRPIIVTAGTWSTNIGNAFFQLGAAYLMSQAAPAHSIHLLSDQAGYWQYGRKKEPTNSARLLDHVDADYLVLSGSVLTYSFPSLWVESLKVLKKRNTRLVLLGAGQFDYTEQETALCRDILKEYPPYLLVSRDSITYKNFKDLAVNAYDGIDNAFFLPLAYPRISLDYQPYIVLNFDKGPEPVCRIIEDSGNYRWGQPGYHSCCVPFHNHAMDIQFPRHKQMISDCMGKYYGYFAGILGLKKSKQDRAGDYLLLRTDHQTNPLCHSKLYHGPGAFAMDVPYGYLALYGNTVLTLSDRIHACAVTMAYGGTAMLFSKSPRAHIIDRVGSPNIFKQPSRIDPGKLDQLRTDQIEFLKSKII